MECPCNDGVHNDYKENVLFGKLVLSNGELAHAQFWFPSEKNPRPNAGTSYSLKVNKVIGYNGLVYDLFGDDKFFVEAFSLNLMDASIITMMVPSNLMRVDGWEMKKRPLELNESWVDCFGGKWNRDECGRYHKEKSGVSGFKMQFIPRLCCSLTKTAFFKHVLGEK